jgi:putative membrane protein
MRCAGSSSPSVIPVVKFVIKVVILAAAFYGMAYFHIPKGLGVDPNPAGPLGEFGTYLWIGLVFGVVNAIVGPILRLLSLPFVLLTLGLFLLVVNAALLGLTAAVTDRLTIDGFGTAILGGLILAVVGWVADQVLDR